VRLDSPLFWVNAAQARELVLEAVESTPGTWMVLLDLEGTNQIDTTAADMLCDLLHALRDRRVDLMLVRVFYAVRRVLRRTGFETDLGPDRMWHSISQGIRAAKALRPEMFPCGPEADAEAADGAGSDLTAGTAAAPDGADGHRPEAPGTVPVAAAPVGVAPVGVAPVGVAPVGEAAQDTGSYEPSEERIAVELEPVVIHGLTAGYEGDPPTRGPRWWHGRHRP